MLECLFVFDLDITSNLQRGISNARDWPPLSAAAAIYRDCIPPISYMLLNYSYRQFSYDITTRTYNTSLSL